MNNMEGWIKLHRAIQQHWIWEDEKFFRWWLTILLNVNHEPKKFPVGNELVECKPGQSFRSISSWTELFKCSKKTTIKYFAMIEKDGMINRKILGKGNRRKHLLTVLNWKDYQQQETENSTERVPKIPPKEYLNVPPNKNDKNDKNDKKKNINGFHLFSKSPYFDIELLRKNIGINYEKYDIDYYHEAARIYSESKGKKYKDWKSTIQGFMRRDESEGKAKYKKSKLNAIT